MLLPSGPDTVRDSPLRGTRSSTSPGAAASERGDLEGEFSPAGADCRYRAPLVPRLARLAKDSAAGPAGVSATGPGVVGEEDARRVDRAQRSRLVVGEPELADVERDDLGERASRHSCVTLVARASGGEGGIRTPDALPRTAFPVRRHSPLGDLSSRPECRGRPPAPRVPNGSGSGGGPLPARFSPGGRQGRLSLRRGQGARRIVPSHVHTGMDCVDRMACRRDAGADSAPNDTVTGIRR